MFCPLDTICGRQGEVLKFIGSWSGLPVHVEEDVGFGFDHRLLVGQRHSAVVEMEPAPFVSRVGCVVAGADSENKRGQTEQVGNCPKALDWQAGALQGPTAKPHTSDPSELKMPCAAWALSCGKQMHCQGAAGKEAANTQEKKT